MTIAIRELGRADNVALGQVLDALQPGWSDLTGPATSGPTAFLADPASFLFGCQVEGEPVGYVWGAGTRYPDRRIASRSADSTGSPNLCASRSGASLGPFGDVNYWWDPARDSTAGNT